ncbi:MAG: L-histidine N(alpha)-methyltransferase [Hyphomicrobiaceae bacterium]|nr:L-histidine N(alpha)-methyltransferase [Hyphomicrobiaceae bacterium]
MNNTPRSQRHIESIRDTVETHPSALTAFGQDVLDGLSKRHKSIPPQWFYDRRGSALFEEITALPEYYPTRTEIEILHHAATEIGALLGSGAVLVEPGSGASVKAETLLAAMDQPAQYIAIEISSSALDQAARRLRASFPGLLVTSEVGDFTLVDAVPGALAGKQRHVFFPGSTLGNFEPDAARGLLRRFRNLSSEDGILLIGVDLRKSLGVLIPAYDDAAGVTAQFNLNLLERINRELDGTFDVAAFEHRVRYDMVHHRIEMHLAARKPQRVHVLGRAFDVAAGETIHTENSYKYSIDGFSTLAASAGWRTIKSWTDDRDWFAVFALGRG